MKNSNISWTDHTFNPWIGCSKVSPGCLNCYAETLDRNRFSKTMDGGTKAAPVSHWGKGAPRHRTSAAMWKEPLAWNDAAGRGLFRELYDATGATVIYRGDMRDKECPRFTEERKAIPVRPRVFCASLADWLDDEVPIEWLADLLELIRLTPHLDWLLLTKRPEGWGDRMAAALDYRVDRGEMDKADFIAGWLFAKGHQPANVWIGTSVEDQTRADERIPALLNIPARVRFLSCEPLLGAVDLKLGRNGLRLQRTIGEDLHWVIVGGESGPGARPMHPAWARSLRDQCAAVGVAFHFKQWGEWAPTVSYMPTPREDAGKLLKATIISSTCAAMRGATVYHAHPSPWDEARAGKAETMHRVGKVAAGRLLDGIEHNAFPEVRA